MLLEADYESHSWLREAQIKSLIYLLPFRVPDPWSGIGKPLHGLELAESVERVTWSYGVFCDGFNFVVHKNRHFFGYHVPLCAGEFVNE